MVFEDSETRQKKFLTALAVVTIVLFLLFFLKEVIDLVRIVFAGILWLVFRFPYEMPSGASWKSIIILGYNLFFGFGAVFFFWILLLSAQALLPITSPRKDLLKNLHEIQRTAWHLFLYIIRRHGQAVFVKDGEANITAQDLAHRGPGVVVVDFNSAVVLEERLQTMGLSRPFISFLSGVLRLLGLSDPRVSPRARGPGIVFTHRNESIRGVVDLRKQFRLLLKVPCYTREGIEIVAHIISIFSIGQDPDVLQVAFVGERRAENLRVLTLDRLSDGRLSVKDVTDELDADDRAEIFHYALQISHSGQWKDFNWLPAIPPTPKFNQERVFAAVFAQARNSNQEVLPWTELPTRVAADMYREILSQINYDDLYDLKGSGNSPLPQHKRKIMLAMRNNGILSFRMVSLKSGKPLARNAIYHENEVVVSEVRPLTSPKVLRDRGIKIMVSSFSDPRPVSEAIYKQRLDNWRAKWESELKVTTATYELEAMKVRSRAHALAQKEMTFALARIFESQEHSDEAIALRIFQALEQAAADPKTRQLLPSNTIELMKTIHALLLPIDAGRPAGLRNAPPEN